MSPPAAESVIAKGKSVALASLKGHQHLTKGKLRVKMEPP